MCSRHDKAEDQVINDHAHSFNGGRPQSPWRDPGKTQDHKHVRKQVNKRLI